MRVWIKKYIEERRVKMLLENKKILIMGIRNKWSIAFGIAKSAYENGAELLFTCKGEENKSKIEELVSEFKGSKVYLLDEASDDEQVKATFEKIKEENGKIDGIVHAIAHAFTEDLHNDFIQTSKEGYLHACEVSAYSFVLAARIAKELDMLNENILWFNKSNRRIQCNGNCKICIRSKCEIFGRKLRKRANSCKCNFSRTNKNIICKRH